MRIAWVAAAQQRVQRDRYGEFTQNLEERNFSHDIVDRIQLLSYCFDRLCELGIEYYEIRQAMAQNQQGSPGIDLGKVPLSVLGTRPVKPSGCDAG